MAAAQLHSPSSSSAESNFRELDDVFLQTQTRIWLGEVLQIRLDDQLNISDLLADGELLFEASRIVWKMLLKNHMEPRHAKAYKYEPFASRRRSGKYMPYSNVDSFLKICKILGLAGIDLFTPSDVVEKRNTRKVCMCIRSLSKKARSEHLNVPDFDIVTYTVTMPTNMVGWIRRSLERSQSSFSSSASDNSHQSSRSKSIQSNLVSRSYGSDSDESDEAESNPSILQSVSLPLNFSDDASCEMNSTLEYLPELASATASATEDYMTVQNLELDNQNSEKVENSQLQSESLCEPVGTFYLEHDFEQNDMASPTCTDSIINDRADTESGFNQKSENGPNDRNDVDFDLDYVASVVEDSIDAKTPMSSIDRNSNACSSQVYCDESSLFDGEVSNGFKSNSSHGSNATQRNFENGYRRLSDDGMEVSSSSANMHSLSEEMMNLDIYDQLDDFGTTHSSSSQSHDTLMQNIVSSSVKPSLDMEVADDDTPTDLFILFSDLQSHSNGYTDNVLLENGVSVSRIDPIIVRDEATLSQGDSNAYLHSEDAKDTIEVANPKSIVSDNDNVSFMSESVANINKHTDNDQQVVYYDAIIETAYEDPLLMNVVAVEESEKEVKLHSTDDVQCQETTIKIQDGDIKEHVCRLESIDKDEAEQGKVDKTTIIEEADANEVGNVIVETQNLKPRRRPLLKSVVKGTAVVSMLFIAFHLRRNGREQIGALGRRRTGEPTADAVAHVQKTNGVKLSLGKVQKGGIYPAEKLNFW